MGVNVLCVFVGWKWPCVIGVGDVLSGVLTDVSSAAGEPGCLLTQLLSVMHAHGLPGVAVAAHSPVRIVAGSQFGGWYGLPVVGIAVDTIPLFVV